MKLAWMFPGQGTQKPGLGRQLFSEFGTARDILSRAAEISGHDLVTLRERGPQSKLDEPQIAEPLLCATQCSYIAIMLRAQVHPEMVFGYSAGEVAALYAAGSLSLEDALRASSLRGSILQKYCQSDVRMVVVQGIGTQAIEDLLASAPGVHITGFNAPDHTTIVGSVELLRETTTALRQQGAELAEVNVAGPWHTPALSRAACEIESELTRLNFKAPNCPLFNSATGLTENDPQALRHNLAHQVALPVLWQPVMESWRELGVGRIWEVGPGQLLRMLRRMWTDYKSYEAYALESSSGQAGRFMRLLPEEITTPIPQGNNIDE